MPRLSIKKPPIIKTSRITVVKPSTAVPDRYFTSVCTARMTLNRIDTIPIIVTSCSGRVLNEVALVTAYFMRLKKDHLLVPNCLSCTS